MYIPVLTESMLYLWNRWVQLQFSDFFFYYIYTKKNIIPSQIIKTILKGFMCIGSTTVQVHIMYNHISTYFEQKYKITNFY